MPHPEKVKGQYGVLWQFAGRDRNGQITVSAPRQIALRWEKGKRKALDDEAEVIASDATAFVNEQIPIHSIMREGKLASVPTPPTDLFEVTDLREIPDIKGRKTQRTATLVRWKKPLPAIV